MTDAPGDAGDAIFCLLSTLVLGRGRGRAGLVEGTRLRDFWPLGLRL